MSNEIFQAWYSRQHVSYGGSTCFYKREDGTEVEVTCVTRLGNSDTYKWPDKEYLGLVVEYSRIGRRSPQFEESLSMTTNGL